LALASPAPPAAAAKSLRCPRRQTASLKLRYFDKATIDLPIGRR